MLASIRQDLYQKGLRIIGTRLSDNKQLPRDPLFWHLTDIDGDTCHMTDQFGELWQFDTVDLDFY